MLLRLPARILEHPVESLIAGMLLLVLLLGSADRKAVEGASQNRTAPIATAGKV